MSERARQIGVRRRPPGRGGPPTEGGNAPRHRSGRPLLGVLSAAKSQDAIPLHEELNSMKLLPPRTSVCLFPSICPSLSASLSLGCPCLSRPLVASARAHAPMPCQRWKKEDNYSAWFTGGWEILGGWNRTIDDKVIGERWPEPMETLQRFLFLSRARPGLRLTHNLRVQGPHSCG